ncbi:Uncharacterised protein [Legionella pneumophila]|nr:hypothetical protein ULM_26370 [Legionella pneumophila]CZG33418.1 Uncharacterised protein [Legionella pneumophila]CZG38435.1 Uncharacterised protein [Legionella pneumophila]CZG49994.1 Uncharacterised protein [Legionella pneumophila]CZG66953.1 Uncharacterised protein [Legionella pneumophila]
MLILTLEERQLIISKATDHMDVTSKKARAS